MLSWAVTVRLPAIAAVLGLLVSVTAGLAGPSTPADASVGATRGDVPSGCAAVPAGPTTYQYPDGTPASPGDPNAATVYTYDFQGSTLSQRVPPSSWRPATASAQELAYYGIPPRPSGGAELESWNAHFGQLTFVSSPGMCVTNRSAGTSNIWSGWEAYSASSPTAYDDSEANWTEAHTSNGCYTSDAHATWVGLGGDENFTYGQPYLLQNGTEQDSNQYAWWEAIKPNYDTHQVALYGFSVHDGDGMGAYVWYQPGSPAQVTFSWFDYAQNEAQSLTMQGIAGVPVSEYYYGSTAEAIDERPTINNQATPLRDYGNVPWSSAYVHGGGTWYPIRGSEPNQSITMEQYWSGQFHTLSSPFAGTSADSFTDQWDQCGLQGP
ncbi:MAG: G1 family glutamic endopeptidase [Mycobacteriales bacterium]